MIIELQPLQTLLEVRGDWVTLYCFACDAPLSVDEAVLWQDDNSLDFAYYCDGCTEKRLKQLEEQEPC